MMDKSQQGSSFDRVFVTDFDGTMTRHDFYKLVIELLLPSDVPDYWAEYRAGRLTHFEALRAYFSEIRAPEAKVLEVTRRMELDPKLPAALELLKQSGWHVIVASAGCRWYIERILEKLGLELEIHANPGRFELGKGLLMEPPSDSPYFSPTLGVDKAAVVRDHAARGKMVAFAGDGFPDAEAARIVSPELRFARGDLAAELYRERLPFRAYTSWSMIADCLVQKEA